MLAAKAYGELQKANLIGCKIMLVACGGALHTDRDSPDFQVCFLRVGVWVLCMVKGEGPQQHNYEQYAARPHIHQLPIIPFLVVAAVYELW